MPGTESPRKQLENEEYHANDQGPKKRKLEFHLKKKQNKTKITKQNKIKISSEAEKLVRLFHLFFFFSIIRGFVSCLFKDKKGSSEVTSQDISE